MTSTPTENQGFRALKLAVTPEGYDDIGHILSNLGYSYDNIEISNLENLTLLSTYDVIFINCGAGLYGGLSEGQALRIYVEDGGAIYASDWASSLIDIGFDDAIGFYGEENYEGPRIGDSCTITADVIDPGFAAYLGSRTAMVEFNLGSWVVMSSVLSTTRQYLAGTVDTSEGSMYVPITVSFRRGGGSVVYTSFHYEAQSSLLTQRLMEYLVFTAVTENVASTVEDSLSSEGYYLSYDIRGGINQGETKNFTITISQSTNVKFVLDSYSPCMEFSVQTPAGAVLESAGTKRRCIEIAGAAPGTYTINATGVNVSSENEPFVLAVGTGAEAGKVEGAPTAGSPWLTVGIGVLALVLVLIVAVSTKMRVR